MWTDYDSAMTRAGNVLAVAVGVGLIVSACAGSDDATPVATITQPTVEPTMAAPTEPTTTNAPTTTEASTTTIDPATTLAAEVEADLLEAFRLGARSLAGSLQRSEGGRQLSNVGSASSPRSFKRSLADYRTKDYAIRPNESIPASVTIEGRRTSSDRTTEVRRVQVCEVDSWILVEVGAGPNGTDAIVDPDVLAYRSTV